MVSVRDVMAARKGVAPGFGMLRHALSVLILVEHCYIIALGKAFNIGYVKNDLVNQAQSLTAKQLTIECLRPVMFSFVGAFFVLSGFLVFGSALRNRDLRDFFVLRVIRIVPALAVEITISALLIGPMVTTLSLHDYFTDSSFFAYFGNIIGWIHFDLPGVFKTNPTPNWVNANLWTLPSELECYVILGVTILCGLSRNKWRFTIAVLLAAIVILLLSHVGLFDLRGSNVAYGARYIVFLFFCGVVAYMFADKIPLSAPLFIVSVVVFYIANITRIPDILAAPCLVYAVVYIGCCDFSKFDKRLGGDYSYGIYLYGYPLTQMVMFYIGDRLDHVASMEKVAVLAIISIPLTCVVAFLSWHLIERHCLKLRRYLVKARPMPSPAAPTMARNPAIG